MPEAHDPYAALRHRDYRLLLYLLDHASGLQVTAWEDRLLIWDYRLMRCWCALARIALPGHTRAVLSEMLNVGIVLSARMTERAGISVAVEPGKIKAALAEK